ncbi:hypothetical protein [uncultured Flavobacterium sp.]|uniref:hypothetical protein n=1 Tax=uncultured Flavobacterium sp. TaxID=165435 RepID=UPI0025D5EE0C|nr:hypothetical protein [uncultured Flavobacterium sp.]
MEKYANRNGQSGISAYEIGTYYIRVKFSSGSIYQYSYTKAGQSHVDNMKRLAIQGYGLNSYINANVKFKYD